jgi:lipoprotein NlpI
VARLTSATIEEKKTNCRLEKSLDPAKLAMMFLHLSKFNRAHNTDSICVWSFFREDKNQIKECQPRLGEGFDCLGFVLNENSASKACRH